MLTDSLKTELCEARKRGDAVAVRRILAALQASYRPENTLAAKTTETREEL